MKTLVIQRGHVPRTTGYTGTAGEQEVVTAIAAEAVRIGPPAGWQLRVIDADEPDYRYRGDAFIALHCDGSTNRAASGASVGYQTPEGEAFAKRWKAAYAAHGWPHGFKADNYTENLRDYYGFRHALAAGNRACMVAEHGYLTNATDAAWIRAHITECARAIMAALPREEAPMYFWVIVAIFRTAADAASYAAWCAEHGIASQPSGVGCIAHGNDDKSRRAEAEAERRGGICPWGRIYTTQESYKHFSRRTPLVLPEGDSDANATLAEYEARFDRLSALLTQAQSEIPK